MGDSRPHESERRRRHGSRISGGESAVIAQARRAVKALGLRAAAVDLFTELEGDPEAVRVIEVNSNPSIRLLEECARDDLILKIWRHTFSAMGLL